MIVLGFLDKKDAYASLFHIKSETINPENGHSTIGLYFNEKTPERQEIMYLDTKEMEVVKFLNADEAYSVALNSFFCSKEHVTYFLECLKETKETQTDTQAVKLKMIRNYLLRGFLSVI